MKSSTSPASTTTFPAKKLFLAEPVDNVLAGGAPIELGCEQQDHQHADEQGSHPGGGAQNVRPALGKCVDRVRIPVGVADPFDGGKRGERGECGHGHPESPPLDRLEPFDSQKHAQDPRSAPTSPHASRNVWSGRRSGSRACHRKSVWCVVSDRPSAASASARQTKERHGGKRVKGTVWDRSKRPTPSWREFPVNDAEGFSRQEIRDF